MTRIIAGAAGGRRIATPRGSGTRPTTDRVREALFSRVESLLDLEGARVLDLYAGSGALGLEAASRGAAAVRCVESDRPTARLAADNARQLGLGSRVEVTSEKVERHLLHGPGGPAYDLAVLDPPYPLAEDRLQEVLQRLVDGGWLGPGALVVVERSARSPAPSWPAALRPLEARRYGETAVHVAELSPAEQGAGAAGTMPDMTNYPIPRPVSGDVVELILDDHRLFEALMRELRDSSSDREAARAALADVLIAHGEAEEQEVYPQLESKNAIDAEVAEHGEHEHAELNEALLELLECRRTDTQKFEDAVEKLNEVLQHHITEEELTILNPARQEVASDVRERLGAGFLEVRSRLLDTHAGSLDSVRQIVERDRAEGKLDEDSEG